MNLDLTQPNNPNPWNKLEVDKILAIALLLGLFFSLYGIHWGGWVESWNPDQMALRPLFNKGKLPFEPDFFQKPPFHTYFNFFLSVAPLQFIGKIFHLSPNVVRPAILFWSRLLIVFLFLGSIFLVFQINQKFFGIFSARIVALVFSTSAGFIIHSHFLTADIPVLFWMLVAFYFAQNISLGGKVSDYAWAGFFTGIATATKYNGLAVGIAIVVAHILSFNFVLSKESIFSKKLFIGLGMVSVGFLIGNPFAILDYSNFISDFWYNYTITPVYDGNPITERSYGKFLLLFTDLIGIPSFSVFAIAFIVSLDLLCLTWKNPSEENKGIILLLSVFLLYYYKFGAFPRLPVRFVMPIVPFWLMMSGPFWNKIKLNIKVVSVILAILISYNSICCFYVGKRFAEDPRMQAQQWVKNKIPEGSSIEYGEYTPNWNLIPGINLKQEKMPFLTGRRRIFEQLFPPDSWVVAEVRRRRKRDLEVGWYTLEQLNKRHPDYIAVDSLYYQRFLTQKPSILYPSIKEFYKNLLEERYPYKIVFDRAAQTIPSWLYPQRIKFVDNRITILARSDVKGAHRREVTKSQSID